MLKVTKMISVRNEGRRPIILDSTIPLEIKTMRPPIPNQVERLEEGDLLVISVGYSVELILKDDILAVRAIV